MNYSWNWSILIQPPYLGWLASGLELTLVVSISAWVLALIAGTLVGVVGTLPHRIPRMLAATYVGMFRNVPLLLQLFLWFFVVPELLPAGWGHWLKRDLPFPELWTSMLALGLFTSARVAVQVGSGITAVSGGQRMAAVASGLSPAQTYRLVLLPQAFRIVLPPLTSNFLTVFKNSALALTIGVFELTAQSRQIESFTFQGFEAFTAAPTPAGQFTWQDLVALRFAVPMQFWDPAGAYLMNQKTAGLLFTMSDANGRPIMIPSMQNPLVFTLLGSPLRIATQMPDVAPGATPVAYGNWKSAYMVANRKAITMQHDPYSAGFCSLFKFESRIGGAIVCPAAAKVCRLPGDGLPARHWVHSSDGSERGLRPRAPELYQARRPDRPPVMNSRRFVGISKKEPLQPLN